MPILRTQVAARWLKGAGPETYIFQRERLGSGPSYVAETTVAHILKRACKRASVPVLSAHKAWYMTLTLVGAAGVALEDIAAFVRHSDTGVTLNVSGASSIARCRAWSPSRPLRAAEKFRWERMERGCPERG